MVKFIEPSPGRWRVVFTPLDGGRPRLAERNTADPGPTVIGGDFGPWAPLALKQGKEQSIAFKIDKRYWFVEARDKADKKVEPLLHLPSGIYSVTVSHSLGDWKSKIPDAWNDPVTTDTVQVEITR